MPTNYQIEKLQNEFLTTEDTIEKNFNFTEKLFPFVRQQKINTILKDYNNKYNSLIYNCSSWSESNWAGNIESNINNEITIESRIWCPENRFYEIFTTNNQLEYYPTKNLYGLLTLDYEDYVKSKIIYCINDYEISYENIDRTIGGVIYHFKKPIVTDNYIPTNSVRITLKGYAVEWHGQDNHNNYNFIESNNLLKWNGGKYNNNVWVGGTMGLKGTYTGCTIKDGKLILTSPTGSFVSDTIVTSTKDIESILISKNDYYDNGTITYYVSSDDGSNWQEVLVFDEYFDISNIGKKLKIKIVMTGDANISNIYFDTDEFSVNSDISSENTLIEIGNDSEGFTSVINGQSLLIKLNKLQYKITCIKENTTLYLKSLKVEYT